MKKLTNTEADLKKKHCLPKSVLCDVCCVAFKYLVRCFAHTYS